MRINSEMKFRDKKYATLSDLKGATLIIGDKKIVLESSSCTTDQKP